MAIPLVHSYKQVDEDNDYCNVRGCHGKSGFALIKSWSMKLAAARCSYSWNGRVEITDRSNPL